jgi:hypothetical protein
MFRKSKFFVFVVILLLAAPAAMASSARQSCATIQDGTILDSAGNIITTGYDQWGYNYQAMMFNGYFDNNTRPATPVESGDSLIMKWNSAWLSNLDCDHNGYLDRHYGYPSYIGSGAWLTNHQSGEYTDSNGLQKWNYFSKIVAAPLDATLVGGNWVGADGIVIGYAIWGDFAVVQEIYNDSGTGDHGVLYKSPARPGFGFYKP